MSMTDLKRAIVTVSCIRHAINASAQPVPDWLFEPLNFWEDRVVELERAEHEPQQVSMLERLATLEGRFEGHSHDFFRNGPIEGGTTGPICR